MRIPVIFAINNEYVKQLATVIVSILKNSATDAEYEFNILGSSISECNKDVLKSLSETSTINFIDMNEVIKKVDLEKYMSRRDGYNYISVETYYRFFIPELFPQHEKVIYLDADILVLKDLAELYRADIKDFYAGVVHDTYIELFGDRKTKTMPQVKLSEYFREKLKKTSSSYFNAGVLLLNIDKIRKDNIVEKLWEFAQKESPLEYQDQDVLNAVLENNVKFLDGSWNVLKDLEIHARKVKDKSKAKYLMQLYKNPGIFHYVGDNKPWDIHRVYNFSFVVEWWDYYKLTPFYDKFDASICRYIEEQITASTKHYFTITLFGVKFVDIYKEDNLLKFRLFGLKTRIKLKKV